jgi:hypothetical protein
MGDKTSLRRMLAGLGMAAVALLAATLATAATARASGESDVDPFADAGFPNGAAIDASFLFATATSIDDFVDSIGLSDRDADPFTDYLGTSGAQIDSLLSGIGLNPLLEYLDASFTNAAPF